MRGLKRITVIISFTSTCLFSHAAIPPQQISLEVDKIQPIQNPREELNMAKIIPTNLQPGQSEEEISLKVLDHSVNSFTQADFFRNTEIGRAATGIEKSLQTKVDIAGDPESGEISHSFNLQIQAFEQKAWVKYSGLTDFQLTYLANQNNFDMELREQLGGSTNLVITHNLRDQVSRANLSWNW